MKRIFFLLLVSCIVESEAAKAQDTTGRQQAVSFGFSVPFGDFSSTHFGGIAVAYSLSKNCFGKLATLPKKKMGFLLEAGLAYYFGKKETVSGYPYQYPGYYFFHVYPGLVYNLCKEGNISLAAGPALGLYNGNVQFNMGTKLQGTYYVNEKIGITPALLVMKEPGADPLFAASLKATLAF